MAHGFAGQDDSHSVGIMLRHLRHALGHGDDGVARDVLRGMLLVGADVRYHLRALVSELWMPTELLAELDILVIYLHFS